MNLKEMRSKNLAELKEELAKLEKDLRAARIAFVQRKEKNIKKPLLLRKSVAKLLTIINEKKVISEEKNA